MGFKISYSASFSVERLKAIFILSSSLTVFSLFFFSELLPLPKLLLFIAKVSGEIMITATASAIEGPILSALSRCLGESGMQQLWPWNLVPA